MQYKHQGCSLGKTFYGLQALNPEKTILYFYFYIFHPEFTWRKLREERTGEFEDEITNPPNPDKWFRVRINIDDEKVEVYVNERTEAVLTINQLTSTKSKKIGLWTGYGSSGRYRNLVLSKE